MSLSNRYLPLSALVLLAVASAAQQPQRNDITSFRTEKLGEGIFVFIPDVTGQAVVTGNSLVVVGDDGVLVVDSGHFPSVTAKQIEQIEQRTKLPVKFLINTHWHPDHNAGNGIYLRRFPGLQIVSTEATRSAIIDTLPKKELTEKQVEEYSGLAARGTTPDGKPITDAARPYFTAVSAEMSAFLPELKRAEHTPPNLTFSNDLTLYLGKRQVRVLFLGRGNTAGDAVVYVPDAQLVSTGDLLVSPIPYPFGSFIGEWIATLAKLRGLNARTIVPGHGLVMHDAEYLDRTVRLLQEVKRQTDEAVREGLSLEDTRKKIDVAALRSQFVGDDQARGFFFDRGFLSTAVTRAYREAKEGPLKDEN